MADSREALLAKLAALDKKELGAEAARTVLRLHQIRSEAAQLIVDTNDQPNADMKAAFQKAANLAEEAAQLGARMAELRGN